MVKRLAIIPARKGSQRVKNKNIYNFFGKPIIWYALNNAKKSKLFDTIHVSSNCEKTLSLSKKFGFEVDFKRPNNLSNNQAGLLEVIIYVLEQYQEKKSKNFDVITLIYPWSPLITHKDLLNANKIFEKNKKKYPLISISSFPAPSDWAFKKKGKFIEPVNKKKIELRSQDLSKNFFDTGDFVFYSFKQIKKFKKMKKIDYLRSKFIGFEIDRHRAADIDELRDIEFAKKLYSVKHNGIK